MRKQLNCDSEQRLFNTVVVWQDLKLWHRRAYKSVCLCACISQNKPNFTKSYINVMLPVAVARSLSDGRAICHVIPILCMTSCFHIMGPVNQNQALHYVSLSSENGGTGGEIAIYDCRLVAEADRQSSFHCVSISKGESLTRFDVVVEVDMRWVVGWKYQLNERYWWLAYISILDNILSKAAFCRKFGWAMRKQQWKLTNLYSSSSWQQNDTRVQLTRNGTR